jgi:tryptophan synthase alpha chain
MGSTRLAAAFEKARAEGRIALIGFVMPGFPSLEGTDAVFDGMVAGGVDIVEVEIPFSDPLADGASIQKVAFEALENGTTPTDCIEFVRRARSRHPETPIVFMSYLNPILAYGLERFAADAGAAGADGIIPVDLPPEEADEAKAAFAKHDIDIIFLVSPTSSEERIQYIAKQATGWVYCVSVAGVTGARDQLPSALPEFIAKVRACTAVPLAIGFGISRREHIEALTGLVDGAIVGSAYMDVIRKAGPLEAPEAVRRYTEVLTGRATA